MAGRLRIDSARFAHETIDGETVVIDTIAGQLTLITGVGAVVWERLVAGQPTEPLLAEATGRYGTDAADQIAALVGQLRTSGLLVADDGADSPAGQLAPWPSTYVEGQLERFDDIADIMTMDPIHEVDVERGWPRRGSDEHGS